MILNKCNFFSKALLNHVDVDILLPGVGDNDCVGASLEDIYAPQNPFPVLYLLHGALDDHTMWLRHTNIEEFATHIVTKWGVFVFWIQHKNLCLYVTEL